MGEVCHILSEEKEVGCRGSFPYNDQYMPSTFLPLSSGHHHHTYFLLILKATPAISLSKGMLPNELL